MTGQRHRRTTGFVGQYEKKISTIFAIKKRNVIESKEDNKWLLIKTQTNKKGAVVYSSFTVWVIMGDLIMGSWRPDLASPGSRVKTSLTEP